MMPPLLAAAIGSILRAGLLVLAGYLVKAGIWDASAAETYVGAAVLAILTLGWSLWQKYHDRIKFLTALDEPAGTSEAQVTELVSKGFGVAPKILGTVLLAGVLAMPACAKNRPPNLTPQATIAFDNARAQGALDQIRDIVQVANAQTPPVVVTKDARTVTQWHRAAIVTLHARTAGWQTTISTGLDEALKNVSPKCQTVLAPYVTLVKTILAEVQ